LKQLKIALLQLAVVLATIYQANPQRFIDCIEVYYKGDLVAAKMLAIRISFDVFASWILIMFCQPKGGVANDK
jgi:hypothetical protein